ncbi:hypothetical protein POM88_024063 [Heracleum sosnowskyi]|uniref:Uncharacterized protein n=1 Tax=Heracleum sosnowskyi TaxID=360622 RepID=A0AAD8MWJ1_9APIA|nr:hypothetical protein POM88_024063 [Heracleum sosnowskyi]
MERVGYKLLVVVSVLVMISGWEGVGGRKMTMKKKLGEQVDEPEDYSGSFSGTLPGPFTGTYQSPGYTVDFPSPGLTTGTLPSPSLGSGSPTLCGFPGVMCSPPTTPVKPAAASLGGGTVSP